MTLDSGHFFQRLMRALTLSETREEKESILFWLLEHELKLSRADVIAGRQVIVDEGKMNSIVDRLNRHEPIQYILGEAAFYGRRFTVSPAVLIPRPETEVLVELALGHMRAGSGSPNILDVGTGSGCIAVTLALELPGAHVVATDVSNPALATAKANAEFLGAIVQLQIHNILEDPLSFGSLDAVISNPPYISEDETATIPRNVMEYEPAQALFVRNPDPLIFYKALATKSSQALRPGGLLLTEINERFGAETAELFRSHGFRNVTIGKDLSGKDRLVFGIR